MKVNNKDKSIEHQEKLPPLNKRASSVDQNYQEVETEQSRCSTSKNLSTSIKENQSSRIKKSKMERSEVFTSKMKTSTNFLYQDINSKLIHINDLNKQVLFWYFKYLNFNNYMKIIKRESLKTQPSELVQGKKKKSIQ